MWQIKFNLSSFCFKITTFIPNDLTSLKLWHLVQQIFKMIRIKKASVTWDIPSFYDDSCYYVQSNLPLITIFLVQNIFKVAEVNIVKSQTKVCPPPQPFPR